MKIFERINTIGIVCRHFETLYRGKPKKLCWSEISFWYFLPFPIFFVLVYKVDHLLEIKFENIFFQVFAIFGGFLFNAIVMLAERRQRYNDDKQYARRANLIDETHANTAFALLICIIIILLEFVLVVINCGAECDFFGSTFMRILIRALIFSFSFAFLHTLLMIIKRLDKIFRDR